MENSLYINEIFASIQGEGINMGRLSVFVRLQGCNIQCNFCDTKHSWEFKDESLMTIDTIIDTIQDLLGKYSINNSSTPIIITGGEPLLQDLSPLVDRLKELELCNIWIETSGGTINLPINISFSPKRMHDGTWTRLRIDKGTLREVKLISDDTSTLLDLCQKYTLLVEFNEHIVQPTVEEVSIWLQPCEIDGKIDPEVIMQALVNFPYMRAGVQLHKLYNLR